jgi:hypothetical protein
MIAGRAARAACSPDWINFLALANESHDMSATGGAMTKLEYLRQLFCVRPLMIWKQRLTTDSILP